MTAVVTGGTLAWFATRVGTEGFKVWNEFLIPTIIAFKLNLGNNMDFYKSFLGDSLDDLLF